jgi:hypothetical protein
MADSISTNPEIDGGKENPGNASPGLWSPGCDLSAFFFPTFGDPSYLFHVHCPEQKVHPFHLVNVGHVFPFLCLIPPLRMLMGNRSAQRAVPCFVIKVSGRCFVFVSVAIICLPFFCNLFYKVVEMSFSSSFLNSFTVNGH